MAPKRHSLIFMAATVFFIFTNASVSRASDASQTLVAEGRAVLFQGDMTTYADILTANEKFKKAVAADSADPDANLFYAVSRIATFLLQNSAGGLNTAADLLGLFGAEIMENRPLGEDPVTNLPSLYDQYNPPDTVPDGETVRAFLAEKLIAEIDAALANLAVIPVGSGYGLTVTAAEIAGDTDVQIDDGDVLVARSSLELLRAASCIVTAYDLDVDLRELLVLDNGDVLGIQKILDLNPNMLHLRPADGADQLAAAKSSLLAGIDSARAAYDFIAAEQDPQDDDLFYFDSYRARQQALEAVIEAEEIKAALNQDRPAEFREISEHWRLTNDNADQIYLSFNYLSTPPADTFTELIVPYGSFYFYGNNDGNFFSWGGSVEKVFKDGNQITWHLTTGGYFPSTAVFTGTIAGDTISGTYTIQDPWQGTEGPFAFTGNRDELEAETDTFNPNAVFGNPTAEPLDIKAVLPKFGVDDEPVPGTFPSIASGDVLNGIIPGMTNQVIADELNLHHQTRLDRSGSSFFTIPTVSSGAISLDGKATDWTGRPETLVFTDFTDDKDEWADLTGTDIQHVYAAKDGTYLYLGIQLADGNPLAEDGMAYFWEAMNGFNHINEHGNLMFGAHYLNNQWVSMLGMRNWYSWTPDPLWTGGAEDVATGSKFIEWRVPLWAIPEPGLSGRWLRAYSHQTTRWQVSDNNVTQIQLDTGTLTGTVSCPDCTGSGKFFIYASPSPTVGKPFGSMAESSLTAAGTYTLTGIPVGHPVYLHVHYDADDNGILSFGDTLGISDPLTFIGAGTGTLNVAADTPVNDSFVMTKPGVYRVFGADANPLGQPYYGPWDPNEINWNNADFTFLGEFAETASINVDKFYRYILILWNGDRVFHFDAIQDQTANTAFGVDENGNWVGGDWITAGLSNLGGYTWDEPSNFSGLPDGQVAATRDYPGFSLLEMPLDTLDDNAARQLQITLGPGFSFDSRVMNLRKVDGMHTLFFSDIYDYSGHLPEDIEEWAVTGPGVDVSYTGAQIAAGTVDGLDFSPEWNEVSLLLPGSPQVGTYTFSLTINGNTRTYTDTHHLNRDLPLPDSSKFSVQPGAVLTSKTPMFSWAPITDPVTAGIDGAPIAYRFWVRDRNTKEAVYYTGRRYGMTHCTVPAGRLLPGRAYEYYVRAIDSDDWLDVQNRSNSVWVPFSMASELTHASPPRFKPDWNALTYTTPGGTILAGSVTIEDADGIASDGSSHYVSMTTPNGYWIPLYLDDSRSNQNAYYWGNQWIPAEYIQAGTYTFTVTDPDGLSAQTTDTLVVNPLAPVDEAQLRPSLLNPAQESIHAVFDDVKINGTIYDSFDACFFPDPTRWNYWDNEAVQVIDGALHLSTRPSVGRADTSVTPKDPAAAHAVEAKVTVVSASSDNGPRARLSGYWFNLDGIDVFAAISVNANRVGYSISKNLNDETFHWEEIDNGTLKTVTVGQTVTVGIAWDGQHLTFKADEATHTYTPAGTILPARYPGKWLQARINLNTSITPTFHWNPIEGANRYRVRIYNNNSRTIHRGYVDDGQTTSYTVPHGVLRSNAFYRYRIEAWDTTQTDVDNVSKTPTDNSENFIFYTGTPGDLNSDGFVDLADVIRALKVMANDETVRVSLTADADADQRIGAAEAMRALQEVAGLP